MNVARGCQEIGSRVFYGVLGYFLAVLGVPEPFSGFQGLLWDPRVFVSCFRVPKPFSGFKGSFLGFQDPFQGSEVFFRVPASGIQSAFQGSGVFYRVLDYFWLFQGSRAFSGFQGLL